MNTFHLTISSPDGNRFDGDVVKLDVRGVAGELAVMAGHVSFVTAVVKAPCAVWLDEDTRREAVTDGGILTVDGNRVTLLSGSFAFV